jgi:hypothetical protein
MRMRGAILTIADYLTKRPVLVGEIPGDAGI